MNEQTLKKIVDEIIDELSLQDRVSMTHMNKEDAEILQSVFERYVRSKTGSELDDQEFNDIMNELWKKLQVTHKIRVVK